MGVIRQLPEAVANQIAAGEVVERPASVIKELLENAIDAGATRIQIEIEGGGIDLIRVSDDGLGMDREDAKLCLVRHATSKITAVSDLDEIGSLGFRGEALPSIASVSRLTLTSARSDSPNGTRVIVEGGYSKSTQDFGAAPGTIVEVRDLFYNIPARRKFLKQPPTEMSHINIAVTRIALAHPQLAFQLKNEGRVSLDIPAEQANDPKGRLVRILGEKSSDHLYVIEPEALGQTISVSGWCGAPMHCERTTRGIYCFVNGRFVRDRTMQHAIADSYRSMIERGRHPNVLVHLQLDSHLVDVNVHPQKTEVRFIDSSAVHRAITRALGRCLSAEPWTKNVNYVFKPALDHGASRSSDVAMPSRGPSKPSSSSPQNTIQTWDTGISSRLASRTDSKAYPNSNQDGEASEWNYVPAQTTAPKAVGFYSGLRFLGQLFSEYLVCQSDGEIDSKMLLVDQRAARIEILIRRMNQELESGRLESQPLLIPRRVELDAQAHNTAQESKTLLKTYGFVLEEKAAHTWMLKSIPSALAGCSIKPALLDVLQHIAAAKTESASKQEQENLFRCISEHSVAAKPLLDDDVPALLVQMDALKLESSRPPNPVFHVTWTKERLAELFRVS